MEEIEIHGHRGCRGILPENTVASFFKAIELGVNAIELDVVVTKEKQLLISHEPWMRADLCLFPNGDRISQERQQELNIYDLRNDLIQLFDCGSLAQKRFPDQINSQHMKPLFLEAVKAIKSQLKKNGVYLNIEIKSHRDWYGEFQPDLSEYAAIILHELKYLRKEGVSFMIQSFDPGILNKLNKLNEELKLGYLIEEKFELERELDRLSFKPNYFNPNYKLIDKELIKALKSKDIKCFAWTVNDKKEGHLLMEAGIDGIITDYPTLFSSS